MAVSEVLMLAAMELVMGMDGLCRAVPGRVTRACDLPRQGIKEIPSLKACAIFRLSLQGNGFRRRMIARLCLLVSVWNAGEACAQKRGERVGGFAAALPFPGK